MKKVLVALFILLSFSLGFADKQGIKEPGVYTDGDLNQYRSHQASSSKDETSSSSTKGEHPCKGWSDKFNECDKEPDFDRRKDCHDYYDKKFWECSDDYKYGPPVRVRIVPH
ncbi:MAG: hypothetical protein L6290_03515 [Thermodesulfovibrionales bacterium]|nr:hypothetical protein [Thermodesulfovibrionales bacterium]